MAESIPAAPGRIFISYRRVEAEYPAGWLDDRLVTRFGRDHVFKDVDSIELGDDFVNAITNAVRSCDALLVLMGPQWLTITAEDGRRRLDKPNDFVRLEIEAALEHNVRIIPILLGNALMPQAEQLPVSLAPLARRQALELSPNRFTFDTERLLRVLNKMAAEKAEREAAERAAAEKAEREAAERAAAEKAEREAAENAIAAAGRPPSAGRRRRVWVPVTVLVLTTLLITTIAIVILTRNSGRTAAGSSSTSTAPITGPRRPPTPRRTLLQDDFSNRSGNWSVFSDSLGAAQYVNAGYSVTTKKTGTTSFGTADGLSPDARTAENLRIDVDADRFEGSVHAWYGVHVHASGTGNSYYVIAIRDDGTYFIGKYTNKHWQDDLSSGSVAVKSGQVNHLQVACSGGSEGRPVYLALWVNGAFVSGVNDYDKPIAPGEVALEVGLDKAVPGPAKVQFDNFAAYTY
jgi:hypothetical protein